MNARYGDSGAETSRSAAQRPPIRAGSSTAVPEAGDREQLGDALQGADDDGFGVGQRHPGFLLALLPDSAARL